MNLNGIGPLPAPVPPAPATPRPSDTPAKVRDAAQQFEALLIGQLLHSARGSGGWMGTSDATADCATDYAEEQFAAILARQGGLGLAALIAKGLR